MGDSTPPATDTQPELYATKSFTATVFKTRLSAA